MYRLLSFFHLPLAERQVPKLVASREPIFVDIAERLVAGLCVARSLFPEILALVSPKRLSGGLM